MIRAGMTVNDATHKWVYEFNRFPQDMILELMSIDIDDWREVTAPSVGDYVYLFQHPTRGKDGNAYDRTDLYGEITEFLDDGGAVIKLNDGTEVIAEEGSYEIQVDDVLPMWGTMWQFEDSADDYWLEEMDGIQIMSDCGFRIYESDKWGYFFGIDGCGYDFYEAHWIPLYRKRGLRWHDPETEAGK